ncbi:MAG TPA: tRNA (adenosine(37)-N6)-threonylcarbamoyltransferase complex dimerization subunit type 1 TsaB [Kosmotogaceae bacterium]|nr:MAG: Peptidase M22 glycoprotease [Thermotogales bacterium 46_20]HAA85180.1 tRNA (adenosine(37)-N6)-threonylcarbamoyltransferase complex dimerization subunit type 1 TsaB [Kosmotogaceae bacterium]
MRFLFFDSSSSNLFLAVRNGERTCFMQFSGDDKHGSSLAPCIDSIMGQVSLRPEDLDFIGCGIGPGSLTGVRIGMATAKGLCYPHETPLLPICSLDLVASQMAHQERIVIRRARAGYYYWRKYRASHDCKVIPDSEPSFSSVESICSALEESDSFLFVDGRFDQDDFPSIEWFLASSPSADAVLHIIDAALEDIGPKPFREVQPLYLQRSLAEDNWDKRHGNESAKDL